MEDGTADIEAGEPATFKSFGKGDGDHPGFAFTRYWWEGEGLREGITPWVLKKLRLGDDPVFGQAARAEVLLPPTAPADYADCAFLLKRFDETRPSFEKHAMVQAKLSLDPSEPWHVGYERARGFVRAHFAVRFPVILVAHVPGVAGLEGYGNHVHCIVLPRPVTINGLGGTCHRLCSDRGYNEALEAWQRHVAKETAA
ncbi:hypothetical protein GRI91_15570 [Altererythrobacter endophyticus]|uniref:Uncharacterized protein n=1 Tax=Altericroceibacterium endophyticum TaxID=1808508 RepID=A0A6I4TAI0_9SPHN|nr:hypothetical protein [Altericroceibacterium endophyticum]